MIRLPWTRQPEVATPAIRTIRNRPPTQAAIEAVVLVIDRSSSMSSHDYPPSRLVAAKEAVQTFCSEKRGIDLRDKVAVLDFDVRSREVVGFGASPDELRQQLGAIRTGGSTAMGVALAHAIELLGKEAAPGTVRRIVILSDGRSNSGRDPQDLIPRCQNEGIIVDTVGIGSAQSRDYKKGEPLLRELADRTGGVFVRCDDVQQLIEEYRVLARKKQPASARPPLIRTVS